MSQEIAACHSGSAASGDVGRGILERDEMPDAGQGDQIVKPALPAQLTRAAALSSFSAQRATLLSIPSRSGRRSGMPKRLYFWTTLRLCSRMSALYRSIWPASLDQLDARFLRTWACASLCARPIKRTHSAD
jgi:hypothetical protein